MSERCMNCLKIKHFGRICEHCGHDSKGNLSLHVLPEGVLLAGQYLVGRVLGQGGFGITYYGYDQLLDMPVAIKEFYPDGVVNRNNEFGNDLRILPEMEEYYNTGKRRFLREAKAVLKLMHVPQVVRLHRYFEENNTAYIVMEYVEGVSLRKFVDNLNRNMSMDEVLKLLGPLMESMDQMHDQGLIHRDISPDNIMIQPDNTPKLLDFGAVRQVVRPNAAKGLSNPTAAILKKGFAPPEQYQSQGALGPWTDVYGFAATIYYCMAGKAPVESIVRLADNVPVDWAAMGAVGFSQLRAMKKGLALKATERTPSVGQLYENLMKQDIPRPKGKKPVILAAAAAAVLLAALGLTTLGGNDNNERLTVV
ncbi:MAG: serine/threonine protein kinase, partial [Oscillospiraceae bacterium]|nr:serine/threonine protein kinase [Oscillospiraceae bacterium]